MNLNNTMLCVSLLLQYGLFKCYYTKQNIYPRGAYSETCKTFSFLNAVSKFWLRMGSQKPSLICDSIQFSTYTILNLCYKNIFGLNVEAELSEILIKNNPTPG